MPSSSPTRSRGTDTVFSTTVKAFDQQAGDAALAGSFSDPDATVDVIDSDGPQYFRAL